VNSSFLNALPSSFSLFLNNSLQYFSSGYKTTSGSLYQTSDPNFSQYQIWGSPFTQWVFDESVTSIPSGVYDNGTFIPRGTGVSLDFLRGRILTTGTLTNPTLQYSIPDFNLYYTDSFDDADFLIETAFTLKPTIPQVTGAVGYNSQVVPCIYFQTDTQENKAISIGQLKNANNVINCYVVATNAFELDACVGALCDTARKYFPLFTPTEMPFNYLGDLKSGNYNYLTDVGNISNQVFISQVKVNQFEEGENKKLGKKIWGGKNCF